MMLAAVKRRWRQQPDTRLGQRVSAFPWKEPKRASGLDRDAGLTTRRRYTIGARRHAEALERTRGLEPPTDSRSLNGCSTLAATSSDLRSEHPLVANGHRYLYRR